jgi:hypothetical protein
MDRQFYCEDCHHTWTDKVKEAGETDLLGWPKKKETKTSQGG